MTILAQQIFALRKQGKPYNEIATVLHCSKATVCYYLGVNQKQKMVVRNRRRHPFAKKIDHFLRPDCLRHSRRVDRTTQVRKILTDKLSDFRKTRNGEMSVSNITIDDVLKHVGEKPSCYLTGLPIDISRPSTYAFDHRIPASRGGTSTLDNLGICTKMANLSKSSMTPDEFINLCKLILEHNGYNIERK